MKTLKYWWYGTLFLVIEFVFRLSLDWANGYETIDKLAETANRYWQKAEENRP